MSAAAPAKEYRILPLVMSTEDRHDVDIERIRELSELGLDDANYGDRAMAWLALLNIFPQNPNLWSEKLSDLSRSYWAFVEEFHMADWHTKQIPNQVNRDYFDLPNPAQMAIIHGDVVRTGRLIFFFPAEPIEGAVQDQEDDMIFMFGAHARRLERILYIFASCNSGLGYMQGYNELVSPFYYIMLKSKELFSNNMDIVEALTFQCIQTLLTESTLHELYTTADASSIILHRLGDFHKLLERHIPKAYKIIDGLGIHPLLYCYRWFNLLFSQEHDMPEILTLWDALLAHFKDLVEYSFYVGLGHIKMVESKIAANNYGNTLSALQALSNLNIKKILMFAKECWDKDHRPKTFFNQILSNLGK